MTDHGDQQHKKSDEDRQTSTFKQRIAVGLRAAAWLALMLLLTVAAHALLVASTIKSSVEEVDEVSQRAQFKLGYAIKTEELREFDLGEFSTAVRCPDIDTTLRINFRLFLLVHQGDSAAFEKILAASRNRLRDSALSVTSEIGTQELIDPSLRELKASVTNAANQICGGPIVVTAAFADYSFVDQL